MEAQSLSPPPLGLQVLPPCRTAPKAHKASLSARAHPLLGFYEVGLLRPGSCLRPAMTCSLITDTLFEDDGINRYLSACTHDMEGKAASVVL